MRNEGNQNVEGEKLLRRSKCKVLWVSSYLMAGSEGEGGVMDTRYKDYVAIVGAGISGLSVAYHLLELGMKPIVFEKAGRIGGNAETLEVVLEYQGKKIIRWVDMGVTDYNDKTYVELSKAFKKLGYAGKPIEDTISFSNTEGSMTYTSDGSVLYSPSKELKKEIDDFQKKAYETVTNPRYRYYSVQQYAQEKGFSQNFLFHNLYSRINGMYFCNGNPGLMPIRMVMNYYILQEGFVKNATPAPDRRYFVGGTRAWFQVLERHLNQTAGYQVIRPHASIKIPTPTEAEKLPVLMWNGQRFRFQKIVLATPASSAIELFEKGHRIPDEIVGVLTRFHYASATVVAHTASSILQPDCNSLRTYNIHMYRFQQGQVGPYTITYVVNRHQNDAENPLYQREYNFPVYFLSINPPRFPPESCILRTPTGEPAIREYKHQILNFDLMDAQEKYLPTIQGKYGIYYCNGYGKGAGLHEQCWVLGREVAEQIHHSLQRKTFREAA